HAVMADAPLDATLDRVRAIATLHARLIGASKEEEDAACDAVSAALTHAIMKRAASSDTIRRETPLLLPLEDGSLVEGVIDLAFREREDGAFVWTVVDFKTDVELAAREPKYAVQLDLYVRAIEAATGDPARAVILSV